MVAAIGHNHVHAPHCRGDGLRMTGVGAKVKPVDRCMQQLGIGWEGDGLGLDGGVHRDPFEIACAQRTGLVGDP